MKNSESIIIKVIICIIMIMLLVATLLDEQTSDSWKFIIYGDTRTNDDDHRSVLESISENTNDYRFIINAGDVVGNVNSKSERNT